MEKGTIYWMLYFLIEYTQLKEISLQNTLQREKVVLRIFQHAHQSPLTIKRNSQFLYAYP